MTPLVRLWIWISAFASLAGWLLSALVQLNRAGYAVCFAAFAVFIFLHRKDLGFAPAGKCSRVGKFLRRFRRPLPLCFAAMAVLIFLGGAVYPPTHYNAVTYHIPRVLQWLAAGRWHWIHTPVVRMNYSGCDFEWLFAPLLLFTKSCRPLFLLNVVSFLLLPGLVFSLFTRLGVRVRASRQWMWLLPAGYVFVLQAGSAGNDAFAAVYALAAVDFGCRAWKSRRPSDVWHSILAAALMTGVKASNLPLLLPWAVLIFSLVPQLRRKVPSTLLVLAMAAVVSFFPIAVMNQLNCGDWLGRNIEPSLVQMHQPLIGIAGNAFQLLAQNFAPPLFPPAGWWNVNGPLILPHAWIADFMGGFAQTGELPTEDWAGTGFGVSLLAAVSVVASFFVKRRVKSSPAKNGMIPAGIRRLVLIAPWVALMFFCAKSAMNTPARLITPYYPLLLPLLLSGAGHSQVVRRGWWRALVGVVLSLAFVVLALSPDRPLWPAQTVLSKLAARHPASHLISRALDVYALYSKRSDPLAGVRDLLPKDVRTVGFIGAEDDSDISFWLPLGSRRVKHFLLSDPPERFRQAGIEYVVVGGMNLKLRGTTLDAWLQNTGAQLAATTNATLKVSEGPQEWFVVRFKP